MRILALFCGAFSAGIFAAQYLLPGAYLLDLGAGAFLLACLRFLFPGDAGKRLLLIGTGLSLAFGYYWLYSRQTVDSLTGLYGAERDAVMTLCEYAEPTAWGARASVEINGLPGKVAYYGGRELLELQPGAAIRAIVRLEDARHHNVHVTRNLYACLRARKRGDCARIRRRLRSILAYADGSRVASAYPGNVSGRRCAVPVGPADRRPYRAFRGG